MATAAAVLKLVMIVKRYAGINQEIRAYFEQKYILWASTWVHYSTAFRMTASPSASSRITGWDKLNAGVKESKQNAPPYSEEDMTPYINKFDYEYYIKGSMATVFLKEGKTIKMLTMKCV